ncbi:PepSY domain-containing protein [Cryobacterium melibiosiphilum]|uniref:PepSY domain-containing protein n=1 Tax=Cryobacterium melibiosiphilum TaxID=995039 RepID=A0A3A5MKP8_9MICO|nr:PepSY domain-containing protein [Cryobacterium melibiosiphilum]RJT90677.1 PepSY domain-containing protein [Cryobacterium melibiosiphilum]
MTDATAPTQSDTSAIRDFAAAVRGQLNDLPADDVDDLTDGLEADLTEQAADAADSSPELGDPVAYAAELRAAADLPPRAEPGAGVKRESLVRRVGTRARSSRADAARSIRQSPAGAQLLDFLLVLRPLWWVLRGWAVYVVANIFFGGSFEVLPADPIRGIALLAFVTLSVQWGRGRWLPWHWLLGFRTLVSVCAVLALPWLLFIAAHEITAQNNVNASYDSYVTPGLVQNGEQVTNIFAYDAEGQPLPDVQLFDQDGQPLGVVEDPANTPYLSQYDSAGTEHILVPSLLVPGGSGWNVYPLGQVASQDVYPFDALAPLGEGEATPFPFAQVQPLVAAPEAGEATPSPTPTAEPTASATKVPAPTPASTDADAQQ